MAEETLDIHTECITLGQLLKWMGVLGTGGEARSYLEQTPVEVNGAPEQRRGRKLYHGDCVALPGRNAVRLTVVPRNRP